ncbi:MarR family winged helix-turn-helix transcriptional regulator, partial [Streptomyces rimosus]|uniref:MarR family winged helix-turn-helix transcriptional regulator n=1 Tax=Streptomyces rimosus TaxID=1927 RepID=UPI00331CDAEA
MPEPSDTAAGPAEPSLEQQIAAYQREFQDLDPQVEQVVSALQRLNRRMNVAYGRQTAALSISNAEWEVLKALVVAGAPYQMGPGELAKRLGLTPAAMTHRIDRMASEGLVTRERDEARFLFRSRVCDRDSPETFTESLILAQDERWRR